MERFWSKVNKTATCWLWVAGRDRYGYGEFTIKPKTLRAHRVAYELVVGPIPAATKLDHVCDVRHCVNPVHLCPLSQRDNVLRSATNPVAINARKTHCVRGHAFTAENTGHGGGKGHEGRYCKACRRARSAAKPPPKVVVGIPVSGVPGHTIRCQCGACRLAHEGGAPTRKDGAAGLEAGTTPPNPKMPRKSKTVGVPGHTLRCSCGACRMARE